MDFGVEFVCIKFVMYFFFFLGNNIKLILLFLIIYMYLSVFILNLVDFSI